MPAFSYGSGLWPSGMTLPASGAGYVQSFSTASGNLAEASGMVYPIAVPRVDEGATSGNTGNRYIVPYSAQVFYAAISGLKQEYAERGATEPKFYAYFDASGTVKSEVSGYRDLLSMPLTNFHYLIRDAYNAVSGLVCMSGWNDDMQDYMRRAFDYRSLLKSVPSGNRLQDNVQYFNIASGTNVTINPLTRARAGEFPLSLDDVKYLGSKWGVSPSGSRNYGSTDVYGSGVPAGASGVTRSPNFQQAGFTGHFDWLIQSILWRPPVVESFTKNVNKSFAGYNLARQHAIFRGKGLGNGANVEWLKTQKRVPSANEYFKVGEGHTADLPLPQESGLGDWGNVIIGTPHCEMGSVWTDDIGSVYGSQYIFQSNRFNNKMAHYGGGNIGPYRDQFGNGTEYFSTRSYAYRNSSTSIEPTNFVEEVIVTQNQSGLNVALKDYFWVPEANVAYTEHSGWSVTQTNLHDASGNITGTFWDGEARNHGAFKRMSYYGSTWSYPGVTLPDGRVESGQTNAGLYTNSYHPFQSAVTWIMPGLSGSYLKSKDDSRYTTALDPSFTPTYDLAYPLGSGSKFVIDMDIDSRTASAGNWASSLIGRDDWEGPHFCFHTNKHVPEFIENVDTGSGVVYEDHIGNTVGTTTSRTCDVSLRVQTRIARSAATSTAISSAETYKIDVLWDDDEFDASGVIASGWNYVRATPSLINNYTSLGGLSDEVEEIATGSNQVPSLSRAVYGDVHLDYNRSERLVDDFGNPTPLSDSETNYAQGYRQVQNSHYPSGMHFTTLKIEDTTPSGTTYTLDMWDKFKDDMDRVAQFWPNARKGHYNATGGTSGPIHQNVINAVASNSNSAGATPQFGFQGDGDEGVYLESITLLDLATSLGTTNPLPSGGVGYTVRSMRLKFPEILGPSGLK